MQSVLNGKVPHITKPVFFIPYKKYGLEPVLSKGPKFTQSFLQVCSSLNNAVR